MKKTQRGEKQTQILEKKVAQSKSLLCIKKMIEFFYSRDALNIVWNISGTVPEWVHKTIKDICVNGPHSFLVHNNKTNKMFSKWTEYTCNSI